MTKINLSKMTETAKTMATRPYEDLPTIKLFKEKFLGEAGKCLEAGTESFDKWSKETGLDIEAHNDLNQQNKNIAVLTFTMTPEAQRKILGDSHLNNTERYQMQQESEKWFKENFRPVDDMKAHWKTDQNGVRNFTMILKLVIKEED